MSESQFATQRSRVADSLITQKCNRLFIFAIGREAQDSDFTVRIEAEVDQQGFGAFREPECGDPDSTGFRGFSLDEREGATGPQL